MAVTKCILYAVADILQEMALELGVWARG